MTGQEREARAWIIERNIDNMSVSIVGKHGTVGMALGERVRVLEAEPVERELKRLRAALAAREDRHVERMAPVVG